MEGDVEQELIAEVILEAQRTERARQAMMSSAARRQEAIFSLHANGMSIRAIASHVGCSPSVIQNAISQARASRPKIERRENRVTYELHRAIAGRLHDNSRQVISKALENITSMRSKKRDPISREWISQWERLLNGDVDELREAMLELSDSAEDLRQMSPFAGVLSNDERLIAIKKASYHAA